MKIHSYVPSMWKGSQEEYDSYQEWLGTRPASVRALAAKFLPGSKITTTDGVDYWIVGYTEEDYLILSKSFPNYDPTQEEFIMHAEHLRDFIGGARLVEVRGAGNVH